MSLQSAVYNSQCINIDNGTLVNKFSYEIVSDLQFIHYHSKIHVKEIVSI